LVVVVMVVMVVVVAAVAVVVVVVLVLVAVILLVLPLVLTIIFCSLCDQNKLFGDIDVDGGGTIDYDEFKVRNMPPEGTCRACLPHRILARCHGTVL